MEYLLLVILLGIGAILILRVYRRRRALERIRANPPPRSVIEVRLPRDISDANHRMQRFYQKVYSHTLTDPSMRAKGEGGIDVVYHFEHPVGRTASEMRFLLYAAPEKMPAIKRTLQQAFQGQAEVTVPQTDPMEALAKELRPPAPEAGGADDSADAPDTSPDRRELLIGHLRHVFDAPGILLTDPDPQSGIDLLVFEPAAGQPYWAFFTLGMSRSGVRLGEDMHYSECMLGLPGAMVGHLDADTPEHQLPWPCIWLRAAARTPGDTRPIDWGHTFRFPPGLVSEPWVGAICASPQHGLPGYDHIALDDGVLHLWAMVPLREEELALAVQDPQALMARMSESVVDEIFEDDRPPLV